MPISSSESSLTRNAWKVAGIVALLVIVILFLKSSVHILILIMVSVLMACYFLGLGSFIERKTGLRSNVSLLISVIGTILISSALLLLLGSRIVAETNELTDRLPAMMEKAQDYLEQNQLGEKAVEYLENSNIAEKAAKYVSGFFKTTFGGVGDIYVIFLVGLYFTFSPKMYKRGLLNIVPPSSRPKAEEVLNKLSHALTNWLFGKFISMSLVFVLIAIALSIIGLPLWLPLAFITGALVFIPNFGPLVAAVPTILVALSVDLTTAIIVAVLFLAIQTLEGSIITPKLQNHLVKIPPALIILGQIFAGTLIGIWGLIFATPIVLILKILVEELYIHPMNERRDLVS